MNEQTTPLEEQQENSASVETPEVEASTPEAEVAEGDVVETSDVERSEPEVDVAENQASDVEISTPEAEIAEDVASDSNDVDAATDADVSGDTDNDPSETELSADAETSAEDAEVAEEEAAEEAPPEIEVTTETQKETAGLVKSVSGPPEYVANEKMGRVQRIGGSVRLTDIDHKNVQVLSQFLDRHGRIIPRRKTHVSAKVQRNVVKAIKRARYLALLPYTGNQTRIIRKKR